VRRTTATSRLRAGPSPPLRIGRALEIVRGRPTGPSPVPRLCLPHGLAFGSGEHATTSMLLHALARRRDLRETAVLDLGTGSGVLALAARRLGSRKITATDFDAAAVRTARENESRNFRQPLVRWQCADVRHLRAREKFSARRKGRWPPLIGAGSCAWSAPPAAGNGSCCNGGSHRIAAKNGRFVLS
jgi:SAM-dependent methyltransferase